MAATYKSLSGIAALTMLFVLTTSGLAQENDRARQQQNAQDDNDAQSRLTDQWIEMLSSKVDLEDQQKEKIRQRVTQHDEQIMETWKDFHAAHMKAVMLEAQLYAALEGEMNAQQQQQFRERRNQDNSSEDSNETVSSNSTDRTERSNDRNNQRDDNSDEADDRSDQQDTDSERQDSQQNMESDDTATLYVTRMIIIPAQNAYSSTDLNDQQKSKCKEKCQQFHKQMTQAWSKIESTHKKLVKLEAEKINEIKDVLNEDQLTKLKEADDEESNN